MAVPRGMLLSEAVVVLDGVGGGGGLVGDDAAELDEATVLVAHVEAVEALGGEAGEAFELGDDFVLFAVELDAAEVESAEEYLEGAGDVLDGDAEGGGTVAIDVETQFRLGDLEGGAGVEEEAGLAEFVEDFAGVAVEGVEVLGLED
jgi:hypothetical protein